jgi:hypothetical protein
VREACEEAAADGHATQLSVSTVLSVAYTRPVSFSLEASRLVVVVHPTAPLGVFDACDATRREPWPLLLTNIRKERVNLS